MHTTTQKESITFITTDASLPEKIKEALAKIEHLECSTSFIHSAGDIKSCFEKVRLQNKTEKYKKDDTPARKYIWVISENEQEKVKQILAQGQASIVAQENYCLDKMIEAAIKYYPCLDLPFQKDLLMTVYKNSQPVQTDRLTICLDSYSEFNATEKDIIYYLLQGKTAEQIAEQTYNSVHTINNNIVKIKRKLKVKSKVEIITHFVKQKKR
ncbi:LuxR C-terminal-related transcriptional regulator [Alkalihalophilus pseudofirmus]|uniref:LuxR C-terminal-related transcriptional regulator n=1 Tax=Alkalihalophilus pseudofirmus TaxID=79885 RepID=A0AAJ2NPU7_ALKPS|nr:LuxR C-terminal-related transcriptional regulator [Alkalihalophilus pseudofirmus]MDV2886283.1 LuxR C-terminal-related transcriptional regulator [Alkalihalophilus pseudofirmus]